MTSQAAERVLELRGHLLRLIALGVCVFVAAGVGASLATKLFAITACVALAALLTSLSFFDSRGAMLVALALLLFLGVVRRLVEYGLATEQLLFDPLFVILPVATLSMLAVATRRGAFKDRTPLSSVVLGITIAGLVGALNPLQGGFLAAGIGLVVFLTPVLWFWIGRGLLTDRRMGQLFKLVAGFALLSAVYGLAQTSGWFFSWDSAWVAASEEYAALRVASFVRGFGFSSSAAEYGKLLAAGVVVVVARLIADRRAWWLPGLAALGIALFLSGLRTTLVLTVVAVGVMWGTRRRASIVQLTVYGGLALVLLLLIASQATPGQSRSDAATVLADRQVAGLSDPFNSRSSTLQTHVELVGRAFRGMGGAPIGQGTATITIAGKRFGTSQAGDTDVADAAIAFGVIGVVLYVLLCIRLFRRAHLLAVQRGDWLSLAAIGVVVVSSLQWLNGGLYAANILAWLTFGWIDRAAAALPDPEAELPVEVAREPAGQR